MKLVRPSAGGEDEDEAMNGDGDKANGSDAENGESGSTVVKSEQDTAMTDAGVEKKENGEGSAADMEMSSEEAKEERKFIEESNWQYPNGQKPANVTDVYARQLVAMIDARADRQEVSEYMHDMEERFGAARMRDIPMLCLFHCGSEDFKTMFFLLERYKGAYQTYYTSHEDHSRLVELLFDFWRKSHLHLSMICFKLLSYALISNDALFEIIVSPSFLRTRHAPLLGDIITTCMMRTQFSTDTLTKIMLKTQAKVHELENSNDGSLEREEKKLEDLADKIEGNRVKLINNIVCVLKNLVRALNAMLIALTEAQRKNDDTLDNIQALLWYLVRTYNEHIKDNLERFETEVFTDRLRPELLNEFRKLLEI